MGQFLEIPLPESMDTRELFGYLDKNIQLIRSQLEVQVINRNHTLYIGGKDREKGKKIIQELVAIIEKGKTLDEQKVNYVITLVDKGLSYSEDKLDEEIVAYTNKGKPIRPKTIGQKEYVENIRNKDIVFGIGPAGTGKTYLAVALAINAYKKRQVEKIILVRPAVEAGENLGFLPGDLQEKIDPYLRPLYDALYDLLGQESASRLKEKEVIEIAPLAYMRGRTLDRAFIILDEGQNTTKEQMKMFLTRMGTQSKMVITGDITQIDLPGGKPSGLVEAEKVLKSVKDIGFSYLKDVDVVRHPLVQKIIKAYYGFYHKEKR